jgi:hypothetical protein
VKYCAPACAFLEGRSLVLYWMVEGDVAAGEEFVPPAELLKKEWKLKN